MSDAEVITILICFHFNTYRNFKHYYLGEVCVHWKHLFPRTLSYNRFIEVMPKCFIALTMFLQLCCFGKCTGISFVDSTPIPVIHNKRQYRMKVFKGIAEKGKGTMGWYVSKLYADKGYISRSLFGKLFDDGIHIVTGLRVNMKQKLMPFYDKMMLRKRSVIESLNDMLKNVARMVHSRHWSFHNFLMNMLAAMGAYCYFAVKPAFNFDFDIEPGNVQLVLWE